LPNYCSYGLAAFSHHGQTSPAAANDVPSIRAIVRNFVWGRFDMEGADKRVA